MFQKGLTIAQIATQRGLSPATIEEHIAYFVTKGDVDIDRMVSHEKRCKIEAIATQMGKTSLKTLKTKLGDDVSYVEIKMVLAWLEHRAKL